MSPVLTACARQQTPRFGCEGVPGRVPTNITDLFKSNPIQKVEVETKEDPPVLNLEDALYVPDQLLAFFSLIFTKIVG
jgi:hypothetical protein